MLVTRTDKTKSSSRRYSSGIVRQTLAPVVQSRQSKFSFWWVFFSWAFSRPKVRNSSKHFRGLMSHEVKSRLKVTAHTKHACSFSVNHNLLFNSSARANKTFRKIFQKPVNLASILFGNVLSIWQLEYPRPRSFGGFRRTP